MAEEVRKYNCGIAACPGVYESSDGENYLVVGTTISSDKLNELGLEGKVGKDESVVQVPKSLLEGL